MTQHLYLIASPIRFVVIVFIQFMYVRGADWAPMKKSQLKYFPSEVCEEPPLAINL